MGRLDAVPRLWFMLKLHMQSIQNNVMMHVQILLIKTIYKVDVSMWPFISPSCYLLCLFHICLFFSQHKVNFVSIFISRAILASISRGSMTMQAIYWCPPLIIVSTLDSYHNECTCLVLVANWKLMASISWCI